MKVWFLAHGHVSCKSARDNFPVIQGVRLRGIYHLVTPTYGILDYCARQREREGMSERALNDPSQETKALAQEWLWFFCSQLIGHDGSIQVYECEEVQFSYVQPPLCETMPNQLSHSGRSRKFGWWRCCRDQLHEDHGLWSQTAWVRIPPCPSVFSSMKWVWW